MKIKIVKGRSTPFVVPTTLIQEPGDATPEITEVDTKEPPTSFNMINQAAKLIEEAFKAVGDEFELKTLRSLVNEIHRRYGSKDDIPELEPY